MSVKSTIDSSLKASLPTELYTAIRLLGKKIIRLHRAGATKAWMIPEKNATRRGGSAIPKLLLDSIQRGHMAYTYKGIPTLKNPFDWALYPLLLWEARPKTIIEVGSFQGGSTAWLADTMRAYGFPFQIHSIDKNEVTLQLPDVIFHRGDANLLERSFSPDFMRSLARPLLVIEDSLHNMTTSLAVLNFFHNWLAVGEYIVIEDGIITDMLGSEAYGGGPRAAVEHFLGTHPSEYEVDSRYCDWFGQNVTWNVNGFLRRR
jgi:cephalosporin hydroxylase